MFESKNKDQICWGIIGCGDVTEVKSGPPYQLTEGFELKAVMRRNEAKAKDYAKRHKVDRYYTNASDLINDPDIDAVYIATPPDTHHKYALMVAEAGKPCCVEKPMASTYQECLEMNAAFEKKGIPLFTAYYRRSLPRFTKVKSLIQEGAIGEVRHVTWQLTQPIDPRDTSDEYNWRTDMEVAPGGYFDDLASHGLDLFTFYFGNVAEVSGHAVNQLGLYSAPDSITASWIHESGISGAGVWNFGSEEKLDKVEIYGSAGTIRFSMFEENPISIKKGSSTEEIYIEHPKHVQMPHVENIARDLFSKDFQHPSSGKSGLHTAWFMAKILGQKITA